MRGWGFSEAPDTIEHSERRQGRHDPGPDHTIVALMISRNVAAAPPLKVERKEVRKGRGLRPHGEVDGRAPSLDPPAATATLESLAEVRRRLTR